MRIIPAIDIIDGKCVRLTQGDYDQKVYADDPLEMARAFEDHGAQYLHVVDLDGPKPNRLSASVFWNVTTKPLKIDFGGGLKSNEDLRSPLSLAQIQEEV